MNSLRFHKETLNDKKIYGLNIACVPMGLYSFQSEQKDINTTGKNISRSFYTTYY